MLSIPKLKKTKKSFKVEIKIAFIMIFFPLLLTFCCNNQKIKLYDVAQRIVLTDSVSAKLKNRVDSIEYLYIDMNKITLVKQIIHSNVGKQLTSTYYSFSDDKYLYAGDNFISNDTIYFFPYCSNMLHDTVYYDITNGNPNYLIRNSGYTIFANALDSNRKEYFGTFLSNPTITLEDPIINPKCPLELERFNWDNF